MKKWAPMAHLCQDSATRPKKEMDMQANTAVNLKNQLHGQTGSPDRQQLEEALNNWREHVLRFLRDQMGECSEELRAAEDGLGIAHRNQGEVANDVIGILWDKLEDRSILLFRLARTSDRIEEMDLCELITLFSRTVKIHTYAWEGDAWQLPSSMF
jgi:hypothetical protein